MLSDPEASILMPTISSNRLGWCFTFTMCICPCLPYISIHVSPALRTGPCCTLNILGERACSSWRPAGPVNRLKVRQAMHRARGVRVYFYQATNTLYQTPRASIATLTR